MDFRVRAESFEEADRQYGELVRKRDAGSISEEEFDAERQQLMVRDEEGRWWAKLGESGEWHRRDGGDWVRGNPPGYQEAANDDNPPARHLPSEGERSEEIRRRRLPLWIPVVGISGIALIGIVVVFWVIAPFIQAAWPGDGLTGVRQDGGGSEAVFVHRATLENISGNSTYIDSPLTNDNPDAVLVITPNWNPKGGEGVYNDHSVGVWYDSEQGRWAIFNQDREAMTEQAAFNVAVQ